LIRVCAGQNATGLIYEELPAVPIGDGSYELLASPGLALNLANGDRVRIDDAERLAVVLSRGGNFCIQIYADQIAQADVDTLERQVHQELHGSLDGGNGGNLAFSVPAANGLDQINRFLTPSRHEQGSNGTSRTSTKTSKIQATKPFSIGGRKGSNRSREVRLGFRGSSSTKSPGCTTAGTGTKLGVPSRRASMRDTPPSSIAGV
jgi:hypothetical protein